MTSPDDDSSWDWVVAPEEGSTYTCVNEDLGVAISRGARIFELRTKASLSAQEVEDYTGITKANLLAMEAGLLEVDNTTAESLAMVYGVSVAEVDS